MKQSIASQRDDELLALIGAREADAGAAEEAWLELYKRHVRFVYSQVQAAGSLLGRPVGVEDIVERVFQRVWFRAAARFERGHYEDADHARRHVMAFLGRIATHEFKQAVGSRGNEYLPARDPTILSNLESTTRNSDGANKAAYVRRVAEEVLSADELEIVWLKMQHFDADAGESRVTAEDLSAICGRQKITKEAFRKRYERALAKIEAAISCVETASQND